MIIRAIASEDMQHELRPAIAAPRHAVATPAGTVAVYRGGAGRPALLLHSINAAASSYEMKPIFEHLAAGSSVHALDLPGFGASERQPRSYAISDFTGAIQVVAEKALANDGADRLDIVALSLSAEFAARVALSMGRAIRSLTLINPTGFDRISRLSSAFQTKTKRVPGLEGLLRVPGLSDAIFAGLSSRPSIGYFLRQAFGSNDVPQDMMDYAYESAHLPNARHAAFSFASGALFSGDPQALYRELNCPVWLAHGDRGDFVDFSQAQWVARSRNWSKTVFASGAFPHFQASGQFFPALDRFHDAT